MATSMPSGEKPRKGPRVIVRISPDLQFLLTQVAMNLFCSKQSLHDAIWAAGLKAHLGLAEEDLDDMVVTTLPRGAQPPRDPRRLVQAIVVER